MEDINIVIAGAAGEGIQTIGDVLSETLSAQGYAVFSWKEYESRMRGGQNSYSIRIGDNARNAPLMEADVLLCLNKGSADKYESLLKKEGILMASKKVREKMITLSFTEIAENEIKLPEETGIDEAKTVLIGWGSSRNAILEALDGLNAEGKKIGMIHFTELWPLPDYDSHEENDYWTVESNYSGQLARLLKSEYNLEIKGTLGRYDGLPLIGEYIRRHLNV
jgi:Pyruvate/2-oxoacid:ferredoxin oxidoreductase gamma subunit